MGQSIWAFDTWDVYGDIFGWRGEGETMEATSIVLAGRCVSVRSFQKLLRAGLTPSLVPALCTINPAIKAHSGRSHAPDQANSSCPRCHSLQLAVGKNCAVQFKIQPEQTLFFTTLYTIAYSLSCLAAPQMLLLLDLLLFLTQ